MADSDKAARVLSEEESWLLAAAYHADRIRAGANNLAGWTVAFLKSKRRGTAMDLVASEFAQGAITLAACVIWNEVVLVGHGGWVSQARAGMALANELVLSMPEVYMRAVNISNERLSSDLALGVAFKYATKPTAETCLEVCRLMPPLFKGPNGSSERDRARIEWRRIHQVTDPMPLGFDDQLRNAMKGTEEGNVASERTPTATSAKGSSSPDRLNPGAKALAAAYGLQKDGLPVSLKAACERAGVDRKNVRERYPAELRIIQALAAPDRESRRGTFDRRTGNIEAIDEDE